MPRRPARSVLPLVLVLAATACRPGRGGAPPERFLQAAVELAVVVPEAGRAARELAAVHATASTFPETATIAGARGALAAQLGFDPLDPRALEGAGVDPGRGVALGEVAVAGETPARATLLVLPVRDTSRLEALLARLARERLGAPERTVEQRGGGPVVVFRSAPGAPPALAYALSAAERTAVLSPGPPGPDAVATAMARPPAECLARSPAWQAARKALGDRYAAALFVPPGSSRLSPLPWARDGIAVGVSGDAGAIRLGAALLLGDRAASFRALEARGAATRSVRRLDPRAFLALRWDGDLAALGRKLAPLAPFDRLRAGGSGSRPGASGSGARPGASGSGARPGASGSGARPGADPLEAQRELLELLGSGGAATLSLSPEILMDGLSSEDMRRDLLRALRFEAVAQVKDEGRARELLTRLAGPASAPPGPARGRSSAPARKGDNRIVTPAGELAWRLWGKRLAVAGGAAGALEPLLARLEGGGAGFAAPTAESARALEGGLGGAVLDVQRLVEGVGALPDGAYGTGPSGFVVRSLVDRFLEPVARLASVSARVELSESALLVSIEVEARTREARR